jgi:DNA repair protein RadC
MRGSSLDGTVVVRRACVAASQLDSRMRGNDGRYRENNRRVIRSADRHGAGRCGFIALSFPASADMRTFATMLHERPRERLLARGAAALTDVELVAVMLRSGVRGHAVEDVARAAVARFAGLAGLAAADVSDIAGIRGIGPAKAAQLRAAVEMVRRALREQMSRGDALSSPDAVRDYLRLTLAARPVEVFATLFLDTQHRLIAADELFQGTLSQTSVFPREVVKAALGYNAAAVIFAHNHPSGVAEPSRADELLTQSLKSALALVDVRTLDHFVVAGPTVLSFAERGLL